MNLIGDEDFYRVGETQIQLMRDITLFNSGDTLTLFYRTIYDIISTTIQKNPKIPITYQKEPRVKDDILLNFYSDNGDLISQHTEKVDAESVGTIKREITLKPPSPGNYSYEVMINRHYPLINGETLETSVNTERVPFSISRDVFYSPKTAVNVNPGSRPASQSGYNVGAPGY